MYSQAFYDKQIGIEDMIIGIEHVCGDKYFVGKSMTFEELRTAVKEIFEKNDEAGFVSEFCNRFGYKELPYSDGYADYLIDLATRLVFVTSHTFPKELDGAKVLYYTDKGNFEPVYYTGGAVAHNVFYLAICKYDNDDSYYLFHIDENMEVVTDDCWDSIELFKKHIDSYDVKLYKQQ